MPHKKLLIADVAALGWKMVSTQPTPLSERQAGLSFQRAEGFFPAVTCTVQASFRTASLPDSHGMVSNGLYFRGPGKVLFWEQSAALVEGARIWSEFRSRGGTVGMMFWQQSLGEDVDLILSPAPIHKHGGGMIQDCYCKPAGLYQRLCENIGRSFNLMHYWGPLASRKSTDWIVDATCATMRMHDLAPDLLLTYLPHLDYDLQRHGPGSASASTALALMMHHLDRLRSCAEENGYDFLFFGDYEITPATKGAIFPNRRLRDSGLFQTRTINQMDYADFFSSRAFSMVDHAVAHIFTRDASATDEARAVLSGLTGVAEVLDKAAQKDIHLEHSNSGDLVLIAAEGAWFAYPWWLEKKSAPDFAKHVDIHNKPGYDPCELFFGWPPFSVSSDTGRIKGSHGRPGLDIAWASSCKFPGQPSSALELAEATRKWLETNS